MMRKVLWIFVFMISFLSEPVQTQEVAVQTETLLLDINNSQEPIIAINIQTLEKDCPYSEEEIYLIALVTLAEAEGECEEGKRLVIDTVLNRIESEHFPNTVEEVIYQPYQFSSMWNDRYTRVTVTDDSCDLVREEIYHRLNSEVIFFTADQYGKYGVPMFQVGNHYFSSYE